MQVDTSSIRVEDSPSQAAGNLQYLKQVFASKKARRKELAGLPFPEKLKIWLELKAFFNSGWRNELPRSKLRGIKTKTRKLTKQASGNWTRRKD